MHTHTPHAHIREGALDDLMDLYKEMLPGLGGYIANEGQLVLSRVVKILAKVGEREDQIFKDRSRKESNQKRRDKGTCLSVSVCACVPSVLNLL